MRKSLFIFVVFLFSLIGCGSEEVELLPDVREDVTGQLPTGSNNILDLDMDYNFLALGDSYTIGESVSEKDRWPVQLVEELKKRGYKVGPPIIIARTGWTTQNLINAMDYELKEERNFDLISILIGVNNQYQGMNDPEYEMRLRGYEIELREIFSRAINHSKEREKGVFALSIPDYGATPFGADNAERITKEIDDYNAVAKKVAKEIGIDFFNITPISREAARDKDLIAVDNLHPSGSMYRLWMLEIVEEVVKKLPD